MSSTVDNRILEMRFDNKQFENGVQTSLNTLNNLKKGLDMSDSAKGLESISQSASRISFGGLSEGVEAVRVKFSALQVAAVTCFTDMVHSAWNAGTRIVSALTIDPVKTGFAEYETQINSVQTILANTQAHQKQVSKEAVQSVEESAAAAAQAAIAANESSLSNLKQTHKQTLKEYNKLAEEELDILEDKYDDELDALNDAIEEETKALKSAHKEKLALYEEEYMEKLRVVDEERYNKIKAIDDEIDAINALTESEEEAIRKEKEQEKLIALENAVLYAESVEEREEAEKDLAEYKAELAREQLLRERDEQIKQLKLNKDSINEEYDLIEENLKTEYEQKKESAQELYELELEQLKDTQDAQKEILKDTYDEHKKLLKEQIELEKEALEEQQAAALASLDTSHKIALQNIEDEKNARIKALTESAGMTEASTLEDVNAALDELNTYADKTIYNFTEMTRNIGTFTAAGIDLDTSVAAIKGIANLAAVSGSTSQQASTAMYQLSQALASGTVKLMDWNSVVNAGMGGQVFQDALKETARVHGIAIDEIIASEGSFRESLSTGWLSADILTETLSKFTGDLTEAQLESMGYTEEQIAGIIKMGQTANDAATKVKTFTQLFDTLKEAAQSGWTATWEIIVGDFEEAKELLTSISDVFGEIIGNAADARNEMLKNWKDLGGRTVLIEAAKSAFESLLSIIKPVKEAFREIFPPMTGEQLYNFTVSLKNLMGSLKLSDSQSENLKTTFKGLFAVLDIVKEAFTAVWDAVSPLLGGTGILVDKTLEATASIGEWLVNLRDTIKETNVFSKAIEAVVEGVKKFIERVKELANNETLVAFATKAKEQFGLLLEKFTDFVSKMKDKFDFPGLEIFHEFLTGVCDKMGVVKEAAEEMKTNVVNSVNSMSDSVGESPIIKFFNNLWEGIKKIAKGIGNAASNIGAGLGEVFTGENFFDIIGGLSIGAIAVGITNFVKSLTDTIDEISNITTNITGILDGIKGCFEAYQTSLKADALMTIATAIALLTAAIVVLAMVDGTKVTTGIMAISALFAELVVSMNLFAKGSTSLIATSSACIALALAVGIMAIALASLSNLDQNGVTTGLIAITGLTTVIVAAAKIMSTGSGQLVTGATSLVVFAAAIVVLASACEKLSQLSVEELIKGLSGVGVLLAEVAIFLNIAKFSDKAMGTATGMVILAAALKMLADVCEDFAAMSWEEIAKGLTTVGALLIEIALFTNLTGNASHVLSTATSLLVIAAAMKVLADAMEDFGAMSWKEIAKGLVAMAVALTEIIIAVNLMPSDMISKGVGLVAIATSLNILAVALESIGELSWEEIAKALITMAGALTILSVALNAMDKTLTGSAALAVASTALLGLAPALKLLGGMGWEEIAKGLIALAGAFTVIGVAGAVLGPLTPAIIALAGAFALIGVGALAIGTAVLAAATGLTALAAGFSALATLGAAATTAVVAALTEIITGVAETIATIGIKLGEAIIGFTKTILEGAPAVCEAVVGVIKALVAAIVESVPLIIEGIALILASTLETIAEYAPTIMKAVMDILTTVVKSIAEHMPEILKGVFDILMSVLDAIEEYAPDIIASVLRILTNCLEAIADNLDDVIEAAVDVAISFIEGITKKLPDVIQAGFNLLISFLQGITDAIEKNTPMLTETMKNLFIALLGAALEILKGGIELVWEAGKKIIDSGLIEGIWSKLKAFTSKVGELIVEGVNTIKSKIPEWLQAGKDLFANVIDGISNKLSDLKQKVTDLINSGLQAVKDQFTEWKTAGKDLIQKIINGVVEKFTDMKNSVKELINNAKSAITDKFSDWSQVGKDLIDGLVGGIKNMASNVVEAAKGVVSDALEGAKKLLGINSPSKEFAKIGRYSDEGLIVGLKSYSGDVTDAAKGVGSSALSAMSDAISGISDVLQNEEDWSPMIRPIIDLTNVESGAKRINALFSRNQALQISGRMNATSNLAFEGAGGSAYGATYQFTQNNYSPKALSRIDIYRQTQNQFSAMERMINR